MDDKNRQDPHGRRGTILIPFAVTQHNPDGLEQRTGRATSWRHRPPARGVAHRPGRRRPHRSVPPLRARCRGRRH